MPTGQASDANSGLPTAEAIVSINGRHQSATDASGRYTVSGLLDYSGGAGYDYTSVAAANYESDCRYIRGTSQDVQLRPIERRVEAGDRGAERHAVRQQRAGHSRSRSRLNGFSASPCCVSIGWRHRHPHGVKRWTARTTDLKRAIDSSRATRSPPRAADTGSCIKPTKTFLEAKCVAVYRARTAQNTNH